MLPGTEAAFGTVGQMAQEKLAEVMKSMPDMDSTPEEFKKWMEENGFSEIIGNGRDGISDQID